MLQLHFFFFLVFLFVFLKKESIFPLNPSQQLQFFFHQRIKVLLRACACTQFRPANLFPPLLSCADGLVSIYYHSCHFLHKWISETQLQVATDWFCSWKYLLLSTSITSQLTPKQHEPLRSCSSVPSRAVAEQPGYGSVDLRVLYNWTTTCLSTHSLMLPYRSVMKVSPMKYVLMLPHCGTHTILFSSSFILCYDSDLPVWSYWGFPAPLFP